VLFVLSWLVQLYDLCVRRASRRPDWCCASTGLATATISHDAFPGHMGAMVTPLIQRVGACRSLPATASASG
jgi:hypothetical protein